eukprot:PhF_6_TR7013/c1_g1_i2/m.10427
MKPKLFLWMALVGIVCLLTGVGISYGTYRLNRESLAEDIVFTDWVEEANKRSMSTPELRNQTVYDVLGVRLDALQADPEGHRMHILNDGCTSSPDRWKFPPSMQQVNVRRPCCDNHD